MDGWMDVWLGDILRTGVHKAFFLAQKTPSAPESLIFSPFSYFHTSFPLDKVKSVVISARDA